MDVLNVVPSFLPSVREERTLPAPRHLDLDFVFKHGQATPGFYVASGSYQVIPRVMDKLVDLIEQESSLGMGEVTSSARVSIGRLLWIDSGNMFDAYYISQRAAERGLDPRRVLRSIQVARPFTAYQFQRMLSQVPSQVSLSVDSLAAASKAGTVQRMELKPLVVLSDLMALFYDEEASEESVQRAFKDFLVNLYPLRERAIIVGLLLDRPAPARRKHLVAQVLKLAQGVISSSKRPSFPQVLQQCSGW